jgi:N-acetylmuramoyl-L-alanine amidase
MPAALLECGVIVNRNEEASLQTPENQHRIADAAAEAIMQFLHL